MAKSIISILDLKPLKDTLEQFCNEEIYINENGKKLSFVSKDSNVTLLVVRIFIDKIMIEGMALNQDAESDEKVISLLIELAKSKKMQSVQIVGCDTARTTQLARRMHFVPFIGFWGDDDIYKGDWINNINIPSISPNIQYGRKNAKRGVKANKYLGKRNPEVFPVYDIDIKF
ncbi:hypothetical protein M2277_005097 [Paenibacillus sp. LBL]|uniref:hypothetical protein n=1 Tax=Paenibacillus sp. LBL TaxID=2940563 RepID=UPI0024751218|nr:hypothetical protein [Paenibacillus sp. LBL]MDH6674405.1 hypothetical protein [Paenibacillus sp. LBL]